MRTIFSILLLSVLCLDTKAQTPFFTTHELKEPHKHAKVNTVFESAGGYIWVGTSDGLFRYDGLGFEQYQSKDSIAVCDVTAIYEDKNHQLWVGCKNGYIFNLHEKKLIRWKPEEGTPVVPIVGFLEDGDGLLWIATYGEGVYYLKDKRMFNINSDDGLMGDDIYVMAKDDSGNIWLGNDGGINICQVKNGEKHLKAITRADGLPDEIVRCLLKDNHGNFWIGMYDGGISYFNVETNKFEKPEVEWTFGSINSFEIFDDRELWIGTDGEGVFRYDFFSKQLMPVHDSKFSKAKIYDLHKDIEGNIWVVTNAVGICSGNRQFEMVNTPIKDIQALLVDKKNRLWVGTQEGLFLLHQDKKGDNFFEKILPHLKLNVVSIAEDPFENIWIGTFGQGVYCWNPISKQLKRITEEDGLTNGSILSMAATEDRMWLATLGGVTGVGLQKNILENPDPIFLNFNQEDGLGTNYIYKVFIDSKGRTWFGTDKKGISVLENGIIKNYTQADGINLRDVYSITEDRRGHIWLSTAEEGIFEFDGNKFTQLTVKEGIRNLEITSLITDAKGNILIVHPSGIDVLDPATRHLIYYDAEVGIEELIPNPNTVCSIDNRDIWIGFQDQLFRYTSLEEDLCIHPRTQLNQVSVSLQPVDFQSNTDFAYHQNNLVFDFIGLWYTDPHTVKYRYILEGFNSDWIITGDTRATFPNLPSGEYIFKVSSTENDAFDKEPLVSYSFTIHKPFWMRTWFLILTFFAVGGLIYGFLKQREMQLAKAAELKKEKIESQLEVLKSQINPHFLFNSFNTLVAIIEENPNLAVEYVERLSDFYRSILQFREQDVISILEELEMVQNYVFLLKKRYGENLELNINLNGEELFVVPMTLQMLVENSVKHNVISKDKSLTINIQNENENYISITNSVQRKLTKEKSTGFGIQSIRTRYGLLNQNPVLIEDNGKEFKVLIPKLK